jgi:hypothetical protein
MMTQPRKVDAGKKCEAKHCVKIAKNSEVYPDLQE